MTSAPTSRQRASAPAAPQAASPRSDAVPDVRPVPSGVDRRSTDRPTPVGPLLAMWRHPRLVVLPMLVVLAAGLAVGYQRPPVYSAEAQLLVGRVDVEANAVPGFVSATQQLAATYARLVSTTVIAGRVATELQVPVREVSGKLQADPIPESSLIRVRTTAETSRRATALAAATSAQLIAFLEETNSNAARRQALQEEYRVSSQELQRALIARSNAEAALERAPASRVTAAQDVVAAARAAVDSLTLRRDSAAQALTDAQRGDADRGTLQLVSEARSAGSDRASRLQLVLAASLVIGGLLGLGLAMLKANRAVLRGLRRSRADGV